jgi:hypothetical protein
VFILQINESLLYIEAHHLLSGFHITGSLKGLHNILQEYAEMIEAKQQEKALASRFHYITTHSIHLLLKLLKDYEFSLNQIPLQTQISSHFPHPQCNTNISQSQHFTSPHYSHSSSFQQFSPPSHFTSTESAHINSHDLHTQINDTQPQMNSSQLHSLHPQPLSTSPLPTHRRKRARPKRLNVTPFDQISFHSPQMV